MEKENLESSEKPEAISSCLWTQDTITMKSFVFIQGSTSFETIINEQKDSFDQYKKTNEATMKSDYKEFLDLNNSTLKEVQDLSAKVTAYEKELPKTSAYDKRLNDIISDIGNLTTKIGELNRNIEKIDRESISKEDYNKLKNELDIIKKDYKPLKEKLESLMKKVNEKTE